LLTAADLHSRDNVRGEDRRQFALFTGHEHTRVGAGIVEGRGLLINSERKEGRTPSSGTAILGGGMMAVSEIGGLDDVVP